MSLARYLARLGYGTRKEVERLLATRRVTSRTGVALGDGKAPPHDDILVDDAPLDPPEGSVILFHKPVGYVCSTRDRSPTVYELLPARFPHRSPVMATVGRLDADTSGLLLLTDDGALNHRVTSPRSHLPKTYRATLAEPLTGAEDALFASGTLVLKGEETALQPASLVVQGPHLADLTITEGRYHQVRRMFAATGNHVVALERIALGPLTLDGLPAGAWRVLSEPEVTVLRNATRNPASNPIRRADDAAPDAE